MLAPSPLKTIWTTPRETVRRIIERDPAYGVILITCLLGLDRSLSNAMNRNLGDRFSTSSILLLACVLGPLGGLLTLWIGSYLIRWTGTWLGGTASRAHLRTAMAWSGIPALVAMPLWIPELLVFGSELFTAETSRIDDSPAKLALLVGFSLIELVLGIWSFVLLCHTVAEVQTYRSAWRALSNLVLAGLVAVVPIVLLAFLLMSLGR